MKLHEEPQGTGVISARTDAIAEMPIEAVAIASFMALHVIFMLHEMLSQRPMTTIASRPERLARISGRA
jgi:hypothetical protein